MENQDEKVGKKPDNRINSRNRIETIITTNNLKYIAFKKQNQVKIL